MNRPSDINSSSNLAGAGLETAVPAGELPAHRTGRRIVLTAFGSLGDLHPYMALALGLQARGHEVVIATTRHYRQRVESRGIGFHGKGKGVKP